MGITASHFRVYGFHSYPVLHFEHLLFKESQKGKSLEHLEQDLLSGFQTGFSGGQRLA